MCNSNVRIGISASCSLLFVASVCFASEEVNSETVVISEASSAVETAASATIVEAASVAEVTPQKKEIEFIIGDRTSSADSRSNVSVKIGAEMLSPDEVELEPGTTVVWVNRTDHPVQVRFTDGAVSTTCKAPRRFEIGSKGIYRSEVLKGGDVASLCFLESQDYPYEILLGESKKTPSESVEPTDVAKTTVADGHPRELRGLIKVR